MSLAAEADRSPDGGCSAHHSEADVAYPPLPASPQQGAASDPQKPFGQREFMEKGGKFLQISGQGFSNLDCIKWCGEEYLKR